jgi:uncharacterized protein (DUF2236 family)
VKSIEGTAVQTPGCADGLTSRRDPRRLGRWLRDQLREAEDWGYFGPGSAIWRLHREAVLSVGLGRAVLLQLAHPWVAQAVADHSTVATDSLDRLFATVAAAELLVFGSRRQADAAADRVRRVHARIHGTLREDTGAWPAGTPYRADDPAALLWVLVTLLETTLRVYEGCFGRLPEETVRAYLADGARLGSMLGVALEDVPGERAALTRYIDTMIATGKVAVGPTAHALAGVLLRRQMVPGLTWRLYDLVSQAVAATTLPAALRLQYAPLLVLRHRPLYRAGAGVGRVVWRRLPGEWRLDPLAALALQRAASVG